MDLLTAALMVALMAARMALSTAALMGILTAVLMDVHWVGTKGYYLVASMAASTVQRTVDWLDR